MKYCTGLRVLGLASNTFIGNPLTWISENLQHLVVLQLRYNKFNGYIPFQMCQLNFLRILDLSSNNFFGNIPRCAFFGMVDQGFTDTFSLIYYPYTTYHESLTLTFKSYEIQFLRIHPLFALLDLSSNNLSGDIPKEVMTLDKLRILNLSRNHLVGPIPPNIGEMFNLESLDLSRNHLSCSMPHAI